MFRCLSPAAGGTDISLPGRSFFTLNWKTSPFGPSPGGSINEPIRSTITRRLQPGNFPVDVHRQLKRAETIVAVLLSLTVLLFLVVRATHARALWRDECDTVQTAQLPTLKDVAANFQYDSSPLPFLGLVRLYTALFGASDASLRAIGLVVGMALIGAAWFNSRSLNADTPLLFLILAGLNTTFLVWGTSLRAYGLGSVLIVLGFRINGKVFTPTGPATAVADLSRVPRRDSMPRKRYRAGVRCLCGGDDRLSFTHSIQNCACSLRSPDRVRNLLSPLCASLF